MWHDQSDLDIVGLLGDEGGIFKGGDGGRAGTEAILEIDVLLEVDGGNIVVVEKEVGSCRDGEKSGRGEDEEDGGEVGFNGGARGQEAKRGDTGFL